MRGSQARKNWLGVVLATGALVFAISIYSVGFSSPAAARTLTTDELGNIAQNCASIRQSLSQLQHSDSRTRVYLGAAYEAAYSNFITPLNVRLVKNGREDAAFVTLQNDFSIAQAKFRNSYTTYMRSLETVINTDCQANPQAFYDRLEATRLDREALRQASVKLADLLKTQIQSVEKLEKELK